MGLLFDFDYEYLKEISQEVEEAEDTRFIIFKNFPLPTGMYVSGGSPVEAVDVLYIIPENYNTAGGDMFWTYPLLARADGVAIPNIGTGKPREDSRTHNDREYFRWSRHWHKNPWKPKKDNVRTIIDRITWAFAHPDAKRS